MDAAPIVLHGDSIIHESFVSTALGVPTTQASVTGAAPRHSESPEDQFTGHADRIAHDRRAATIVLRGNAMVQRKDGSWVRGELVTINLADGWIVAQSSPQ